MIGRLTGQIAEIAGNKVLVDIQGVGYEAHCPVSTLQQLSVGAKGVLIIHTEMKESDIRLYGFHTALEKQLFEFLLQVNGVGPKSALEILSALDAGELIRVIGSGEAARLQKTKGIGKKTAERIVLELQDKLSAYAVETSSLHERVESVRVSDSSDDSVLALISLGFSKAQAETAVHRALSGQAQLHDAGDIVKAALAYL